MSVGWLGRALSSSRPSRATSNGTRAASGKGAASRFLSGSRARSLALPVCSVGSDTTHLHRPSYACTLASAQRARWLARFALRGGGDETGLWLPGETRTLISTATWQGEKRRLLLRFHPLCASSLARLGAYSLPGAFAGAAPILDQGHSNDTQVVLN